MTRFVFWRAAAALALAGTSLLSTAQAATPLLITPLAEKKVTELPAGALFWRIENFETLTDAQAAAAPWGLAAESAGKAWLFSLGPAGGASAGGAKVAEVGPIARIAAPQYLLRINGPAARRAASRRCIRIRARRRSSS